MITTAFIKRMGSLSDSSNQKRVSTSGFVSMGELGTEFLRFDRRPDTDEDTGVVDSASKGPGDRCARSNKEVGSRATNAVKKIKSKSRILVYRKHQNATKENKDLPYLHLFLRQPRKTLPKPDPKSLLPLPSVRIHGHTTLS